MSSDASGGAQPEPFDQAEDASEAYAPVDHQATNDGVPTDIQPAIEGADHSDSHPPGIWLVPAIGIVMLMWVIALVPGMIRPMTMVHFLSMQAAPAIGAIGLIIWWMMSRRLTLRSRLNGLGLVIGSIVLTMMSVHSSMGIIMYIQGIPVALTLLVVGFVVGKFFFWPRQGWIGYWAMGIFLLASLCVRIGQIDAAFAYTLAPRLAPTAEEGFLAELEKQKEESQDAQPDIALLEEYESVPWPEFRGPQRDGAVSGVNLSEDWKQNPPSEVWRRTVGPGWSSFCVVGPLVITQEQRGEMEAVVAYSIDDGSLVWDREWEGRFEAPMGGIGPRATPTYHQGNLYVTGANGIVFCLDASTGDKRWEYDMMNELELTLPAWGFASSPLIHQDHVIVFAGGGEDKGTISLSTATGELAWSAGNGSHGYSSPQLSSLHDVPQILVSSNRGVSSFDPVSGELFWQHEWDIDAMARVTQPMVVGNTVYLGTGYGNGTQRIDVLYDGGTWSTEEKWIAPMKPYFNDAVYHKGFIYGFDGPIFMCIDAESGEKVWKKGRYGHGQVLLIRDQELLLVITEKGELVLLQVNPEKHQEVARMDAIDGVTWNHPVIADGKLYVRNAQEMACFKL